MHFNLKRPCKDCPFRSDLKPFLRQERVEEIVDTITMGDGTFQCHKTIEDGEQDEHCAGVTIMLEKMEMPNQMMRIMERLGGYDRTKLDMDAEVYNDFDEMIDAHEAVNDYDPGEAG